MPIRHVPGTHLNYYLVCHDANGKERADDPDGVMSKNVLAECAKTDKVITDVFLISHGWKGDIPAAIKQYDQWIAAMAQCSSDLAQSQAKRSGFTPLIVGLHWPSLPWGDEELGEVGSYALTSSTPLVRMIDSYAERIADTPVARSALDTIFHAAAEDIEPDELPPEVVAAYKTLEQEAGLHGDGAGGEPGADREPFDPQAAYQEAREVATEIASFGGTDLGGLLLSPLRQLSFWSMKDRARSFGERGAHPLLQQLQENVPEGGDIRFHAMGHSFGCIVVSAMIAGPRGAVPLRRLVDSIMLVQGALSLWSYCSDIPVAAGKSGYFHSIVKEHKVRGPIVTTQSRFDTAVGRFYPLGAGLRDQISYDPSILPKYGGLGTYGARGSGLVVVDQTMLPINEQYNFEHGKIYNLKSDIYIKHGGGASGAHSDISHPEVAHAMWAAVLS